MEPGDPLEAPVPAPDRGGVFRRLLHLARVAVSYLTVLPIAPQEPVGPGDFAASRPFFPVAGLVVGLGWAGAAWVLHKAAVPPGVEGALLLAIPLLLTGFLHLDGLLDCADALLGSRPAARRLEILKDVHLGSFAFGVGALWMLGTWQTLCSRVDLRLLVLLPVLARALVAFWSAVFPYARGSGLPSRFGDSIPPVGWVFLAACCAPCLVLWPGESVVALLVQFVFAFFAARRLGGGLTGDVYGAMICLSESAALLVHIPWKGK